MPAKGLRRGDPSVDSRPEFFPYKDEGCEASKLCTLCPLPQCKYDDPAAYRWAQKAQRWQQIAEAVKREHLSIAEAVQRFGVSRRTVFRAVKREAS